MMPMLRAKGRTMANLSLILALLLTAPGCLIDRIGGAFSKAPEELAQGASDSAKQLIERAYDGIEAARLVDYHTHVIAIGTSVADAFVTA